MKIVGTSLAVFALCLAVTGATAAQDSRVAVVFANPEKYTDLKITCVSGDADARGLKALLLDWRQKELRESSGS